MKAVRPFAHGSRVDASLITSHFRPELLVSGHVLIKLGFTQVLSGDDVRRLNRSRIKIHRKEGCQQSDHARLQPAPESKSQSLHRLISIYHKTLPEVFRPSLDIAGFHASETLLSVSYLSNLRMMQLQPFLRNR